MMLYTYRETDQVVDMPLPSALEAEVNAYTEEVEQFRKFEPLAELPLDMQREGVRLMRLVERYGA